MNYNLQMENIIASLQRRPSLMLQVCCAPCLCGAIDRVYQHFDLTLYFYNPNIYPRAEYDKRLSEVRRFVDTNYSGVKIIEGDYDVDKFYEGCAKYSLQPEGGNRCRNCIDLRLSQTHKLATQLKFDYFCSTLTVSPHKDAQFINAVGQNLSQNNNNTKWLPSDFKKKEGFKTSIILSQQNGIYRQNYCGCEYSLSAKLTLGD